MIPEVARLRHAPASHLLPLTEPADRQAGPIGEDVVQVQSRFVVPAVRMARAMAQHCGDQTIDSRSTQL